MSPGAERSPEVAGEAGGSVGRIPAEYEMSLSVAWEFRIGAVSVTPRLYVYNLLNRQGAVSVNDDFNPNDAFDANGNDIRDVDYGKILARQDPRLLRAGVRVSF
jgi:outer membrane receptor protein involved in Fe transport